MGPANIGSLYYTTSLSWLWLHVDEPVMFVDQIEACFNKYNHNYINRHRNAVDHTSVTSFAIIM